MMKLGWIDTHAHIFSEEDVDMIKQVALEHNVEKVCAILGSLDEVERAFLFAENDPFFDFAIGVHPGSVRDVTEQEFMKMTQFMASPQVKFVGEIGLDYYWDTSFKDLQKDWFKEQIKVANHYNLPISIHMRDSSDDVYALLKEHPVNRKGIAHCFTEDVQSAKRFVELGYHIGVGGIVTFKNGQNIRDLVMALPETVLLTETDTPYLTPHPYRGKKNQPAFVSYVGKEIAKLKGLDEETVQRLIINNYEALTKL